MSSVHKEFDITALRWHLTNIIKTRGLLYLVSPLCGDTHNALSLSYVEARFQQIFACRRRAST